MLPPGFHRDLRRHQRIIGGDHRRRPAFHQPAQTADPLHRQLITVDIRLKKDQILGRIQHHIPVIKFIILIQFLGPQVTESDDDLIPKTIANPINHMQLLRIHTPAERHAGLLTHKHFLNLFIFSQFFQGSQ